MNKNKTELIIMVLIMIILILIGGISTYKIVNNKSIVTSSIALTKNKKNTQLKIENNEEETIQNKNFEDLICQSAMIVGINKAIEESQSAEIKDSEEDIVENKEEEITGYPYYIKINYSANTVTVYGLDESGNYTNPVKAIVCSTGAATPTSGVYRTQNKYQWKLLKGGVYGQYSTRITGSILFHSVPYSSSSKNALISRYYDKLGTRASAGCIRLTTADAKWIYDNCPIGTQVEFYSSSNPGPLGKPTAMKILEYPDYIRCWDPTDPDANNPWHSYDINSIKQQQNNINTTPEEPSVTIENIPNTIVTPTPTPTPTPSPTRAPTPTPTPAPTPMPTPVPTPMPTPVPTPTPIPTPEEEQNTQETVNED